MGRPKSTGIQGVVRFRRVSGRSDSGVLTVPSYMAKHVEAGTPFKPEWHEDGILFRKVSIIEPEKNLPDWVKGG